MDRESLLDDAQWELIEPLLPPQRSGKGRVDSTVNRAHQHATNLPRAQPGSSETGPAGGGEVAGRAGVDTSVGTVAGLLASATGGGIELQRSARLCRSATA
jgi:hypothetical protein